eukprot:CAMPEP_0179078296 /NCGR_PEP_ID=MMETSP0796-20121207/35054_1 /TAXON_ID=73915 /ORGANISM="Pyrodinium bahamense, Strain pbaha01" /LENGTH=910 /DNA_ID=CAMNT_0020775597 /DNA_START=110 /DNA_END=2842 /DNA_ORIENTATION=-
MMRYQDPKFSHSKIVSCGSLRDVAGFDQLDSVFRPKSVAVVGATEKPGAVGRAVMHNLIGSPFGGVVYPINPGRKFVLGVVAYPSVNDTPGPVELAIIAIPAKLVPGIMSECGAAGVKAVIILSAGFKEVGGEGKALEDEVVRLAKKFRICVVGPNCLGVMTPHLGLNASFASSMAAKGSICFLSQSGAMCTAILDWASKVNIGFSALVSVGSMADVDFASFISYFHRDPATKAILIYMEAIGDARRFITAARVAVTEKPVIVIKSGRSSAGAAASASHTGSLAGSDKVLDTAFERAGVLRVDTIEDLFGIANVLMSQTPPRGPRLGIVTNAGGPGVLSTDALEMYGGELAKLERATVDRISEFAPEAWSRGNPADIIGDATPELFRRTIAEVAKDPGVDGILAIITPQAQTRPTELAVLLAKELQPGSTNKTLLTSFMGGTSIEEAERIMQDSGIPNYAYPDQATKVFCLMHKCSASLTNLFAFEGPAKPLQHVLETAKAHEIVQKVRKEGRTFMSEDESKALLRSAGLPVTPMAVARSAMEAAAAATGMGFPVVVKLHSSTVLHKSDVGGVKLNLKTSSEVEQAYETMKEEVTAKCGAAAFEGASVQPMVSVKGTEVILGSTCDPQLGPVIVFGMGGTHVELIQDVAMGLPPLNHHLARHLMMKTKVYTQLQGIRGEAGIDMEALVDIVVRFSIFVSEFPAVKEVDINPLICGTAGIVALDARVVLHTGPTVPSAIRPYPHEYRSQLDEGFVARPLAPGDAGALGAMYARLPADERRERYGEMTLEELQDPSRLAFHTILDYDEHIVIGIFANVEDRMVGITRVDHLSRSLGQLSISTCEEVSQDLKVKAIEHLVGIVESEGLSTAYWVLPRTSLLPKLLGQFGFQEHPSPALPERLVLYQRVSQTAT